MSEDCSDDYYCCDYYTTREVVVNEYIEEGHTTNHVENSPTLWTDYTNYGNNYYKGSGKYSNITNNNDWLISFIVIFLLLAALIGFAVIL